jgi:hypothetical protein
VVYKVSDDFVVGMYSQGKGVLIVNANDRENIYKKLNTCCSGFHYQHMIASREIIFLDTMKYSPGCFIQPIRLPGENNYYCRFMDKGIILLNDPSYFNSTSSDKTLKADYIIMGGKNKADEEILFKSISCENLILSSAIPNYIRYSFFSILSGRPEFIFDTRVGGAWMLSGKVQNQCNKKYENYQKSW